MNQIDELLGYIKNSENNISNFNDSNFDMHIESTYENILSSLINNIKNDAGNYEELEKIKQLKKDISNESRRQYNIIISFCRESEIPNLMSALKQYNILHFFKLVIRVLDINENYIIKVNECKKYFSNPSKLNFYKYLYDHTEASNSELKELFDSNVDFFAPSSHIYDLVMTRQVNDTVLYSLSPKGKNLYAFFMIKNIDFDDLTLNYNEGKVNEVLEYLIEYILSKSNQDNHKLKKPHLNSASANYNLNKLTYLLDKEKSYYQNIAHFSDDSNWIGGKPWKTNY